MIDRYFITTHPRCLHYVIDKEFAISIITKFLKENNCFKEFVESSNHSHKWISFQKADCSVRLCVDELRHRRGLLADFFRFAQFSFSWYECRHIKDEVFWQIINNKWIKLTKDIAIR